MVAWRLQGRRVLVVGGGKVAAGRVRKALAADADVRVVSPILSAELRNRWNRGELDWQPRTWDAADLDEADMVLGAVDDPEESERLARLARARKVPVNCADIVHLCDFWFTAEHRDGPVQIAISSNGSGPAIGAGLVRRIAQALPAGTGEAVRRFGQLRKAVRAADPEPEASGRRMRWLTELARSWTLAGLAKLDDTSRERLLERYRRGEPVPAEKGSSAAGDGRLRLVGAGPGDPDLLTVAARNALEEADLVLSDRLVPPAILALVKGELRVARKYPGRADAAQAELHAWMREGLEDGRNVVRLKCGDPFLFGRGQEELIWLGQQGLEAEVIPGISSAFCAPLAAGIPPTHRGVADRVMVLTGHGRGGRRPSRPTFDAETTFVWLMGVRRIADLTAGLIADGWPPDLPAAIVEKATHPEQRQVFATLGTLAAEAAAAGIAPPAAIVVGEVAALAGVAVVRQAAVG